MKLTLARRAANDVERIREHLRRESPRGAANVIASIDAAVAFIADNPLACRLVLPAVRMKIVRPYAYKIFYAASGGGIEILHIRQPSRGPDWTEHT